MFELDPSFYPDCSTIGFSQAGWNSNDYNCAVTVCPMVENPRILYSDIRTGISTVKAVCEHTNTGGQDVYDDQFVIEVMSNPDYDTSPVTIGSVPDNNGKREAGEERLHQRDFVTKRQSPNVRIRPRAIEGGEEIVNIQFNPGRQLPPLSEADSSPKERQRAHDRRVEAPVTRCKNPAWEERRGNSYR